MAAVASLLGALLQVGVSFSVPVLNDPEWIIWENNCWIPLWDEVLFFVGYWFQTAHGSACTLSIHVIITHQLKTDIISFSTSSLSVLEALTVLHSTWQQTLFLPQAALSIFGMVGGPLLGLFALGILCSFANGIVSGRLKPCGSKIHW